MSRFFMVHCVYHCYYY